MIIQRIIISNNNICKEKDLYFRSPKGECETLQECLIMKQNSLVSFDTYFNSMSVEKWKRYTNIGKISLHIKVKGHVKITIYQCDVEKLGSKVNPKRINEFEINATFPTKLKLFDSEKICKGIIYFEIFSFGEAIIYEASYCADNEKICNDINIALAICTYKREEDIQNNLSIIKQYLKENANGILTDKIKIMIADNAKTLLKKGIKNDELVNIYDNSNCGGAGGFTRCILEIEKYNNETTNPINYVILLDDDAILNVYAVERTAIFLGLLKEEYKECIVGGAMLWTEKKYMQHSSGEIFSGSAGICRKQNYDLRDFKYVIDNEREETVNYTGWYYCCMPMEIIEKRGLPLPIFVHCDDIEYGLRQKQKIITLNGINIWHPCHAAKDNLIMKYYDMRNLLIMLSIHNPEHIRKRGTIIKKITRSLIKNILQYNYTEIKLVLWGVNDFCNGIEWLKTENAEKNHKKLNGLRTKHPKIEESQVTYNYTFDEILSMPLKQGKMICIKCALNWLRPLSGRSATTNSITNMKVFVGKKRVWLCDFESQEGFLLEKKYSEMLYCIAIYIKTCWKVIYRYPRCINEYNLRYVELINKDFWNRYLEDQRK